MSTTTSPVAKALGNEPVAAVGVVIGILTGLLVKYMHVDASTAQEVAAGVVPFVGALIARQFVAPARKLAAAHPVATDEATTLLRGILDALTINEPAVEVLPPVTDNVQAAAAPAQPSTIPAAPEPWTPPSLDIPPILGAMTATPAAAYVAPAPETPPTV